jgi:hypothetical protein
MNPYMAEVHIRQEREQLAAAAERYRLTHDGTSRGARRHQGSSGVNRWRRWGFRLSMAPAR